MQLPRPLAICCAALFLASGAAIGQVLINPVILELGARQRAVSVTVTLSEKAIAPMRLQAQALSWSQNLQGDELTEPSNDLLVAPPIAELRPGEKQVFRVALRGARPAPGELAYRLILEDIAEPPATQLAEGMAIKFRMRYDLPVLVAPAGAVVNAPRWRPCPPAPGAAEACVRIVNGGNRRLKAQSLTLGGDGWQQALVLKDGANLLAGAEREWRVPLQAGQGGAIRTVQLHTVRGETLQAEAGTD